MASRRFNQLKRRLQFLENTILPVSNPTGNYNKKEQDLIRSFLLLCHAEIEAFLEDRAREKITFVYTKWLTNRKKSNSLKAILAFTGNTLNLSKVDDPNNIELRIKKSVKEYIDKTIKKNHGIKKKNILELLLPLGIEYSEIDQSWLNVMEYFGSIRGSIAHSSHSVQSNIDRDTELNRIKTQIIPELQNIDELIAKLR